ADLAAERAELGRGTAPIEVELRGGDTAAFAASAGAAGCQVSPGAAGRLRLLPAPGFSSTEVFRLAAQHKLQVRRLAQGHDTLEDIFLRAMQAPSS
ncbi:MAG: hypothetical protein ACRD1E_04290, partial [Terriglobales bacterium]